MANMLQAQQKDVDSILHRMNQKQPDTIRLLNLSHLASAYMSVDPEMTYKYAAELQELAKKTNHLKWQADALNDMGISWGIRSRYDSSLYYFNLCLKQSEKINYEIGVANSYINTGQVFERLGDDVKASVYYLKALPLFEHSKYDYGTNFCLANLGDIYASQKSYTIALNYYKRSLASYKAANNLNRQAFLLSSIASCYYGMGQNKIALYYYGLSFNIRKKTGDLAGQADIYSGMGDIYTSLNKYPEALNFLLKADTILEKIKDKSYLCQVYVQIANNYLQQNKLKPAADFASKGLATAAQIKSKSTTADALNTLAKINSSNKNYKKAYEYQSKCLLYRDSLFNEQKLKQIGLASLERSLKENVSLNNDDRVKTALLTEKQMAIKVYRIAIALGSLIIVLTALLATLLYRSNKNKKATNLLLEKQKEDISEFNRELHTINGELTKQINITELQNKELAQMNEMKSKLYAVISHDFRSPLSTLKSLVSLSQTGDIENKDMPAYLQQISAMTDQTSILLENLLLWSKNQMDGLKINPVTFDIKALVDDKIALFRSQAKIKGIDLSTTITEPILVFADLDMIKLILRNLVANAIKFTGPNGHITISAGTKANELIISVKDTGTGMSKQVLEKLFNGNYTSPGTASEKGSGLGLMMCKEFIGYNHGRIWAESEPGSGSTFYFTLPANLSNQAKKSKKPYTVQSKALLH